MGDADLFRRRLVRYLRREGFITSPSVAAAIGAVPRERFLNGDEDLAQTYADRAVVLTFDPDGRPTSSISQPSIVALMLEQLAVRPGGRVLEVGTASGYNAALLAHLAGPNGAVTSIEVDEALAAEARRRWPVLGRLVLVHRTGALEVEEVAVLVVASAPHRAEAFEAAQWCIDTLKATVPIWKRETWQDGVDWGTCASAIADQPNRG